MPCERCKDRGWTIGTPDPTLVGLMGIGDDLGIRDWVVPCPCSPARTPSELAKMAGQSKRNVGWALTFFGETAVPWPFIQHRDERDEVTAWLDHEPSEIEIVWLKSQLDFIVENPGDGFSEMSTRDKRRESMSHFGNWKDTDGRLEELNNRLMAWSISGEQLPEIFDEARRKLQAKYDDHDPLETAPESIFEAFEEALDAFDNVLLTFPEGISEDVKEAIDRLKRGESDG